MKTSLLFLFIISFIFISGCVQQENIHPEDEENIQKREVQDNSQNKTGPFARSTQKEDSYSDFNYFEDVARISKMLCT